MVKKIGFLVFVFFLTASLAFVAKKMWFGKEEVNVPSSEISEVSGEVSESDIDATPHDEDPDEESFSSEQKTISDSPEPVSTPQTSLSATKPFEENNTYSFTASIVGDQPTEGCRYELLAGKNVVQSSNDGRFANIPPIKGGRYVLRLVTQAGRYITSIPVRGFIDVNSPEPELASAPTQKMLITKEEFQQRMLNKNDHSLDGGRKSYVTKDFKVVVVNANSDDGSSDVSDIQDVRDMIKTYNKWQGARVVELEYDATGHVTVAKIEAVK